MSEQQPEGGIELPSTGNVGFDALMDTLVALDPAEAGPQGSGEQAVPGTPAPGTGEPAAGAAPAAAEPPAPAGDASTGGGDGAAGQPAPAAPAGTEGAPAGSPAVVTPEPPAAPVAPPKAALEQLDKLGAAFEDRVTKAYQSVAYEAVKTEHPQYFEALEKHPRLLVGTQVPAIGKEGMETLRDANDAREWQEAVKSILTNEINTRTQTQLQDSQTMMETVHNSIALFRSNPDLIPGTKGFDRKLADDFAALVKPYELRNEDKLIGYSIPVQPLLDSLRAQRKAAAPAAPAAAPAAPAASTPAPVADPPQAGVASKAGSSADKEDFSTLFGTIGLPNIQI